MPWKQWKSPPKYFRPSDRWECGRLRSGNPCEHGPDHRGSCGDISKCGVCPDAPRPMACRPRRSLWWRRRRLARAVGVFTLGLLIIAATMGWERELLAPGELSSPHGQILSHQTAENRCAACHEMELTESVTAFLAKSWTGHVSNRQEQSLKCLTCHGQAMPQGHLKSPHDLESSALTGLTKKAKEREHFISLIGSLPKQSLEADDLACSLCHQEHQGRQVDLTHMNNDRCQSCHTDRFQSFTLGHPEFTDYPLKQDTRIAFDHHSHSTKHFVSKNQQFDCQACHLDASNPSAVGPVSRVVLFEKACASCHEAPLRSSFSEGIVVINLPSFDREKIEAAGLDLGSWPDEASLMADGKLSPILQWLLMGDEKGQAVLQRLPASGAINDLPLNQIESLKIQVDLASEIRKLMRVIAVGGQPALQLRLESSLVRSASQKPLSGSAKQGNVLVSGVSPDIFRLAWSQWFDGAKSQTIARSTDDRMRLAKASLGVRSAQVEANQDLSQDDTRPKQSSESVSGQKPLESDDPLLETDPLLEQTLDDPLAENGENASKLPPAMPEAFTPQEHVSYGGWMIDQRRLAIVYVPQGHADLTLTSWISAAASQPANLIGSHFRDLLNPKLVATCTECHRLPSGQGYDSNMIADLSNWKSIENDHAIRRFTKFNHTPHLTLPQLSACTSCHAISQNGSFVSLQRQNCIECHTTHGAGDRCTQCHNYHIKVTK